MDREASATLVSQLLVLQKRKAEIVKFLGFDKPMGSWGVLFAGRECGEPEMKNGKVKLRVSAGGLEDSVVCSGVAFAVAKLDLSMIPLLYCTLETLRKRGELANKTQEP